MSTTCSNISTKTAAHPYDRPRHRGVLRRSRDSCRWIQWQGQASGVTLGPSVSFAGFKAIDRKSDQIRLVLVVSVRACLKTLLSLRDLDDVLEDKKRWTSESQRHYLAHMIRARTNSRSRCRIIRARRRGHGERSAPAIDDRSLWLRCSQAGEGNSSSARLLFSWIGLSGGSQSGNRQRGKKRNVVVYSTRLLLRFGAPSWTIV